MGFRKLKYKNKIEKHYHTDGEQQLSSFFKKKSYQNIQTEQKKDIFVMLSFYFLHKTKMYDKNEEFHFVSLRKIVLKTSSNAVFYMEKVSLDEL